MHEKPVIQLLPDQVINKIAAGEVVERPASVMKELFENSLDAGASQVDVEVIHGGRQLISITDNGCGMNRDQALLSIERHATSKIRTEADIENIHTMGFRGEALAAISSVSRFTLISRPKEELAGTEIQIAGGKFLSCDDIGSPVGTRMEIRNLFFNVPARRKFLRAEQTELSHIRQLFLVMALAHPDVGMSLKVDERMTYSLPANGTMEDRISELYNHGFFEQLLPVDHADDDYTITGFAGLPQTGRKDRQDQYIFVNGRPAAAPVVYHALNESYHALITKGRYPAVFLFIEMEPSLVDVNVHPTKKEVRFRQPNQLRDSIIEALGKALSFQNSEGGGQRTEIRSPCGIESDRESIELPSSTDSSSNADVGDNVPPVCIDQATARTANANPQTAVSPPKAVRPKFETQKQMDELLVRPELVKGLNVEGRRSVAGGPKSEIRGQRSEVGSQNLTEKSVTGEKTALPADSGDAVPPTEQQVSNTPQTATPNPQTAPAPQSKGAGAVAHPAGPSSATITPTAQQPAPPPASPWGWCRIIGQIGGNYVVLETEDGFVLMEPRAAHERVLFEKFMDAAHRNEVPKQGLLAPETIDLLPSDAQIVRSNLEVLEELGFGVSEFGGDTFIIDALPVFVQNEPAESMLVEIARHLEKAGKKRGAREMVREQIAQAACQTAVRTKDQLSEKEIEKLVADLALTEMPYTSPRGRPTLIYTSFTELDRKFSRD